MAAIGVQVRRKYARGIGSLQHHGAGTVTKQHAGGAVIEIQQAAKNLGTHHQRTLGRACTNHGIGHRQRIDKAAAYSLDIESGATCGAQLVLQNAGGRGKHHVWCGRGDDDQINVTGLQSGSLQGVA